MHRARTCALVLAATLAMAGSMHAPTAGAAPISFPPYTLFRTAGDGAAVAIADVSGDGRRDVLMTTGFQGDVAGRFKLLVYRQSPQGGLYAPRAYGTSGIRKQHGGDRHRPRRRRGRRCGGPRPPRRSTSITSAAGSWNADPVWWSRPPMGRRRWASRWSQVTSTRRPARPGSQEPQRSVRLEEQRHGVHRLAAVPRRARRRSRLA